MEKPVEKRTLKVTIIWEKNRRDHLVIACSDQFLTLFANLEQELLERFPELIRCVGRRYFYTDEHGDEITLLTAKDLQNFRISWAGLQCGRIFVRARPEASPSWLSIAVSLFFLVWKCIGVVFTALAALAWILDRTFGVK
uniref:(northern house mosquito) hypothetical protein n=1 Tax=Culex pipiens TaxID=7175 RepID=A0A8D8AHJ8_CULPI